MKEFLNEDRIRGIDFDSAFPETPSVIHEAIMKAHSDIIRYERRKRFMRYGFTAVAACLVVAVGLITFFMRRGNENSDLITPPVLSDSDVVINMETPVFASKANPYFHKSLQCESASEDSVELPLITAIEFEKAACPVCAMDLNTGKVVASQSDTATEKTMPEAKIIVSEGAKAAIETFEKNGTEPDKELDFFGGVLKAYDTGSGDWICATDPTPDDSVFKYVLIERTEMPAEEYYQLNNGTGIYNSYDEATKMLVASWGDCYETHVYYKTAIRVELFDDITGRCAWKMTDTQFAKLEQDGLIMTENPGDFQPSLSVALVW